jgi:hypothetical protein
MDATFFFSTGFQTLACFLVALAIITLARLTKSAQRQTRKAARSSAAFIPVVIEPNTRVADIRPWLALNSDLALNDQ